MNYFLSLRLLSAMLGWLETVLCRVGSSVQLPLMAVNITETSVDPSHRCAQTWPEHTWTLISESSATHGLSISFSMQYRLVCASRRQRVSHSSTSTDRPILAMFRYADPP